MGFLNLNHEKERHKRIRKALARRGMKVDTDSDWEVHGPHPEMNYEIYVGHAYKEADPKARCICSNKSVQLKACEAHKRDCCVAIYPKAVYEIEDESVCWDVRPENRISVKV